MQLHNAHHMYHSWGSHSKLEQITNKTIYILVNILNSNLNDNDWLGESAYNKIKVHCRIMKGVNKFTVWTWNAIGKEKVRNLDPGSPETRGIFIIPYYSEKKKMVYIQNQIQLQDRQCMI